MQVNASEITFNYSGVHVYVCLHCTPVPSCLPPLLLQLCLKTSEGKITMFYKDSDRIFFLFLNLRRVWRRAELDDSLGRGLLE